MFLLNRDFITQTWSRHNKKKNIFYKQVRELFRSVARLNLHFPFMAGCFHSNIVLKFNTLRFWPLLISAITPWKSLFLDFSKTFTTYFLKNGVHVKPTERSVIGQLHSLTYLHSIAIERILFQYSLLHLKDEPKFRRNLMFNNQPLQKNISICIHCVLLHFLIRCNYWFVWAELISVSL